MRSKRVSPADAPRVWVLVLVPGEDVKKTILDFAKANDLKAASFVALGAFSSARLGYFDWEKKEYLPIAVDEQVEVVSLVGDIAENEKGAPDLHAHAVLGRKDGSTRGGHLLEAWVRPTLEVTLSETPAHMKRRLRKDMNVALIDFA